MTHNEISKQVFGIEDYSMLSDHQKGIVNTLFHGGGHKLKAETPQTDEDAYRQMADQKAAKFQKGCRAKVFPCQHQKHDPTTLCSVCRNIGLQDGTTSLPEIKAVSGARSMDFVTAVLGMETHRMRRSGWPPFDFVAAVMLPEFEAAFYGDCEFYAVNLGRVILRRTPSRNTWTFWVPTNEDMNAKDWEFYV